MANKTNRVCLLSNSDIIVYKIFEAEGKTRVPKFYSCGGAVVDIQTTKEADSYGYRLDFDVEAQVFELSKYKVQFNEDDHTYSETGAKKIAQFSIPEQELTILDYAEIDNMRSDRHSYTQALTPVLLFIKNIYQYAKDSVCAQHTYSMFAKYARNYVEAYKNMILYYNDMDKLESLGESVFIMIGSETFTINKAETKRHKILDVPKRVLNYLESCEKAKNNSFFKETYVSSFQTIASLTDDANEMLAMIDYFEMFNKLKQKISFTNRGYSYLIEEPDESSFISKMAHIKQLKPKLDLRQVLNYIIKQQFCRFYYDHGKIVSPERLAANMPSRTAQHYYDYLKMDPVDLFPQDLFKSHNVLAKTKKDVLSDAEKEMFHSYGNELSKKLNQEIGSFRFMVPTDYESYSIIAESFHNCLPVCAKAFYMGLCDIVFVYRQGETVPKYALEISKRNTIVQAKTTRDLDISEEDILLALDKYEKKISE